MATPTINPNNPSHIESAGGDVFVLGSELLRDNPQLLTTYFKQSGYPMTTMTKLKMFGFGMQAIAKEGPITGHYEKARPKDLFTVGSIVSVSGREITVTLSAEDMYQSDNTDGTNLFSRPRVKEMYQFKMQGTPFRVVSKDRTTNPHQITLEAGADIDPEDEIVVGSVAALIAPITGEGTGQIEPLRPIRYKYENRFVIIPETNITSGTNLTTTAPFQTLPGTNLIWREDLKDAELRMEQSKGKVWFQAKRVADGLWSDYSDPLKSEVPLTGTQGLLDYALTNGLDFEYDTNNLTIDDFYAMSNYYHDIRTPETEILQIMGRNLHQKFERLFADKYNLNWVVGVSDKYLSEGIRNAQKYDSNFNAEGLMYNLNVKGAQLGGFTFLQTPSPEFDDIGGSGAIGGKDWMISTPFGFAGVDADKRPYLGYEYRGSAGYSRENEMWMNGGAGSDGRVVKSSEFDVQNCYMRSEIAPHFALGENFIVMRPSGSSAA